MRHTTKLCLSFHVIATEKKKQTLNCSLQKTLRSILKHYIQIFLVTVCYNIQIYNKLFNFSPLSKTNSTEA